MNSRSNFGQTDEVQTSWLEGDGQRDLVSIIVPTYNRARMMIELLENLSQQTWKDLQVIVVDDGSTDDTVSRVHKWQETNSRLELILVSQRNEGPSSARNLGASYARGEFIHFLDSDDLMYPDALTSMITEIRSSDKHYCVADVFAADINGVADTSSVKYVPRLSEKRIFSNAWATHAALFKRQVLSVAGPFNSKLNLGEDSELNWRIVATTGQPCRLNGAVGIIREHNLGHLSYNIGEAQAFRSPAMSKEAYLRWAKAKGFHGKMLSLELLIHGMVVAVRLGSLSDWTYRDRTLAWMSEARAHFPVSTMLLLKILTPRSQPMFNFFRLLMEFALYVRRVLKSSNPAPFHPARRNSTPISTPKR
jgi:glycosyltransferase involved in cell wall biosynthesis